MNRIKGLIKKGLTVYKRISKGLFKKKNIGYCPICEKKTIFIEYHPWLRDNYRCVRCYSVPRYRATINTLNKFFPNWRDLSMHESSPGTVSSAYLKKNCKQYSTSQFFEDVKLGDSKGGMRCEDLTQMTFPDNSFDLFITQDVFEHVFNPDKAFKEINRVLKPGGAHVFTMPWYPELSKSVKRAELLSTGITHLQPPIYHSNPVSKEGSLVTTDWGMDFVPFILEHSGMSTIIYLQNDRRLGLDAKYLEVFISKKKTE
jgi:SAM-dependent methyltransferase